MKTNRLENVTRVAGYRHNLIVLLTVVYLLSIVSRLKSGPLH